MFNGFGWAIWIVVPLAGSAAWLLAVRLSKKTGTRLLSATAAALFGGGLLFFATPKPPDPAIAFQRLALFWVAEHGGLLRPAIVVRLVNEDTVAYLAKALTIHSIRTKWIPRGEYKIEEFEKFPRWIEFPVDEELPAHAAKYIARKLPIRFSMELLGGKTMDLDLTAPWTLCIGGKNIEMAPQSYAAYDSPISLDEWSVLVSPQSEINLDNLDYHPIGNPTDILNNYYLPQHDCAAKDAKAS
jgi:hypothetical protein